MNHQLHRFKFSHPFLLLLTPLPSLGAEWIVEWKEFSSKVPVCRASPRPAVPPPTYFEWRDVWNFVWIAVKWEIWVLTRKAFTRFAYAPRRTVGQIGQKCKETSNLMWFSYLCLLTHIWEIWINRSMHGLRTPNEGINQRYLKNWAEVADKICFGRT